MPLIVKKYADIVEITKTEKTTGKVRLHAPRKRRTVYGARRPDNVYRTKQICVRRMQIGIHEFGCPLLLTLTFKGDASDASYANDALRKFQMRLRTKFPKAHSLFVPELSARGRIHFHGLLFGLPLSIGDTKVGRRVIAYGTEREDRTLAKLWGAGYLDARKTDGSPKLAYYLSKYITKGGSQVIFNAMRILRISHGFPKEETERGALAQETARRYADEKPIRIWKDRKDFVGIVVKKWYKKL